MWLLPLSPHIFRKAALFMLLRESQPAAGGGGLQLQHPCPLKHSKRGSSIRFRKPYHLPQEQHNKLCFVYLFRFFFLCFMC